MSSSASEVSSLYWFWNEDIWLPPNVTWADLEIRDTTSYFNFSDLYLSIPAAVFVILIRYACERTLFRPFGMYMGLRPVQRKKPPTNDVLERHYDKYKNSKSKMNPQMLSVLANQLGMSERQVHRWLRQRRFQDVPSTLDKFTETGWRWFYYTGIFIYGAIVLWAKSWFWDIRNCWYNYPHHSVESDVWWYYMIELSFYWSLCISQFIDTKRKDFWEMFVHHVTTICLMAFSWTCNLTRVGTLVLILHDVADIFLEAAKMCKYTDYQLCCDILFGCFAFTWIVTRIGLYPTWILYSTTIEAPQIVEMFPAYYIFNGLLSILMVLHVIWTYFILKLFYKSMSSGKTEKDARSDSSCIEEEMGESISSSD